MKIYTILFFRFFFFVKLQLEDHKMKRIILFWAGVLFLGFSLVIGSGMALAKSAQEIDVGVDVTLDEFKKDIRGGEEFLNSAKGVLVFPEVIKAGFVVGGTYGEGALRIGGKTVDYYSTAAASFGLLAGAQSVRIIIVFMQEDALQKFQASQGWEAGVDGSVTLVDIGAAGTLDTTTIKDPIVGFVFGNKGLMADLSLTGSKYTKIVR